MENLQNGFGVSSVRNLIVNEAISNYKIGSFIDISENKVGSNVHYVLNTSKGKYFIKILDCNNENIHMEDEIIVCNTLKKSGMNAIPNYVSKNVGGYLTQIDDCTFFNIQQFIEGETWAKYQAPDLLLFVGVDFIADVHNKLKDIKLKQRPAIMRINNISACLNKLSEIENSIIKIKKSNSIDFLLNDIALRRNILNNHKYIDLNKLTLVNGHSDYTITQVISRKKSLVGIIDFSEVSNIPAIWEIMRFYINSAPECKEQRIDKNKFEKYIKTYTDKVKLNEYDKEMLFTFSLCYSAQALSVYEKLLKKQSQMQRYIDRIVSRNNRIMCLQNMFKIYV